VTKEKIAAEPKITVVTSAQTTEILGANGKVTGLRYTDKSGAVQEISVEGVFITIGFSPNAGIVKDLVRLGSDPLGGVMVDAGTNMTSYPGIFAAGDVTTIPYKQAVIAAGEAAKAVLAAHQWMLTQK
jgi:alkyl hydroperoxide reductase subunit F